MFLLKGNITPMFGYYVPYLFITKVANSQMGIDPNTAAFLISIIGKQKMVRYAWKSMVIIP